jgi:hypothetical protein
VINVKNELKHQINLVLGDWSGDGHCYTATITVRCNLNKEQLEKAFKAGCKKTNVDFQNDVASQYEDSTISETVIEKLSKHGFKIEDYSDDENPEEFHTGIKGYYLSVDGYAAAWMFVAKIGNPELEYEDLTGNSPNINIGGYGLFS